MRTLQTFLNAVPAESWGELAFMCCVAVMGLLMLVPTEAKKKR